MGQKLFLSYSKGNSTWRERFLRHLETMIGIEKLWIDRKSIPDGLAWRQELAKGLADSRCALLLLTPAYLKLGGFANDTELPMLLEQRNQGLQLLPVLVEPCSWEFQHPELKEQFVTWRNGTKIVVGREVLRAVSEAGDDERTAAARESAIDRAVMEVCERVRQAFGVLGQITEQQRNDLFDQTKSAFESDLTPTAKALEAERVTLRKEPLGCGGFAVVYRGTYENQDVVVKAIPTAAWRNRVHTALESAVSASERLRDPSFIRVKRFIVNPEVQAIVMEYIDWQTLDKKLAECPGRRLPPCYVARILAKISRAQDEAHKQKTHVGALSPSNIHVNDEWEVRLSPIRIEGHLARGLTLSTGQLVNWDILAMLTPETYGGRQPTSPDDLAAQEQYYLGLLGLELLLGRRPVEISCFQDLAEKAKFFDDPRAFFDGRDGADQWTDENPALAYVLARMLSRNPADRFSSSKVASEELLRVCEGRIPDELRRCLEADLKNVISEGFATRFYGRLFNARSTLKTLFKKDNQSRMLARAVRDLVVFRSEDGVSPFLDHVNTHKAIVNITAEDVEAFRVAFVAEVIATCEQGTGTLSAKSRGDAWNAVLKLGLSFMFQGLPSGALPAPEDGESARMR